MTESAQPTRSPGCAILGISCDYHDAAAALLLDGEIVAAVEQERFSRVKHDPALPADAIASCLETAGVAASDLRHVAFYEKPLVVASRFLATRQREGPAGRSAFVRDVPTLLGTNLMIGARVAGLLRRLGAKRPPPLQYVEHHRSHAAAAFYPSPFEHAAILTVDGLGEWATATIGNGAHHRIELLQEMRYPNSIGLLYSFVTAWCGFRPNEDEYKVMGLAPYGDPTFREALEALAGVHPDGSLASDARALRWYQPRAFGRAGPARALGGPPRRAEDPLTQRELDLAASVQVVVEEALLAMARTAHELTGERRLALAGGVAFNGVANGRLAREGPFEELWVQPAAGDAGSAVGAALTIWHEVLGEPRSVIPGRDAMGGALLGPAVPDVEVVRQLLEAGVPHRVVGDVAQRDAEVASRLADGAIVGRFDGRAEFGPRALGSRSLLADPRSPTVRAALNARVKGRESFRPFAPAVLAEHADEWFELERPSPYMSFVAPVRSEHLLVVDPEPTTLEDRAAALRSTIPACTHIDGSARVQTVDADRHRSFHGLLTAFHRLTGCPVLVNTSFNRAGEPIVNTVPEALATAQRAGLDLLVIGPALIDGGDL